LQPIQQGVQRWQDWWTIHQGEYQVPSPISPPQPHQKTLATADFRLEDPAGKPVQLSQLRGKSVLLAFWSPGAPASLDDVPALKALQQRNPGRLAVIGVCIPAAPSCCADEHEDGHGHEHAHHHHGESSAAGMEAGHMRDQVQQASDRLKINYPMLVDPKGNIGLRFCANDLPAYVLIDSEGMIRRRFVGFRTESALIAIAEEASSSQPATARLSFSANQR
jgi:peroxiredoxin